MQQLDSSCGIVEKKNISFVEDPGSEFGLHFIVIDCNRHLEQWTCLDLSSLEHSIGVIKLFFVALHQRWVTEDGILPNSVT